MGSITHEERLWDKVEILGENDCWDYQGKLDRKGYGLFQIERRSMTASRAAFMLHWGVDLPSWLCVLHECDRPSCCNPAHLWLGTHQDNADDMKAKGRSATGDKNGSRTHPEAFRANVLRGDQHPARLHPELWPRGEQAPKAKLTDEQVMEIRRLASEGMSQYKIAPQFGLNPCTVWQIIDGKTWKHLPIIPRKVRNPGGRPRKTG